MLSFCICMDDQFVNHIINVIFSVFVIGHSFSWYFWFHACLVTWCMPPSINSCQNHPMRMQQRWKLTHHRPENKERETAVTTTDMRDRKCDLSTIAPWSQVPMVQVMMSVWDNITTRSCNKWENKFYTHCENILHLVLFHQ